jgi:hypothetical protein
VTHTETSLSAKVILLKTTVLYLTVCDNGDDADDENSDDDDDIIIIIIIIIIMYCSNYLSGKYWAIFGPKLSGPPRDPDCRGTTAVTILSVLRCKLKLNARSSCRSSIHKWELFSLTHNPVHIEVSLSTL